MNFIEFSLYSILFVLYFIYYKIYKYSFKTESSKFLKWIYALAITGVLFIALYAVFDGYGQQKSEKYPIGYPISITLVMWIFSHSFLNYSASEHFKAKKKEDSFPFTSEFKKVSNIDPDKIPTYPRITIHDTELLNDLKNPKHLIFDSSDFSIINKALGAFDGRQESFFVGTEFLLNDQKFLTEKVHVDFMTLFDDYSGFYGHTDVYEGRDIPYNIQITVYARKKATK